MLSSPKFYITTVVLCLMGVNLVRADAADFLTFMTNAGKNLQTLGKTAICAAENANDADVLARAYKSFDKTIAGIKERVDGALTQEKLVDVVHVLVDLTLADLKTADSKCSDVSKFCPTSKIPASGKTLGEMGKALNTLGSALICLVGDPKPEFLAKVPELLGTTIHNVATYKGASTTSVGILLPEIITLASGMQKVSPNCANVNKIC